MKLFDQRDSQNATYIPIEFPNSICTKMKFQRGNFRFVFFFHVKPTNFPILINHTRVSDVSRQKYLEKLISKENLKKGKKKGISIYFLYFPVSGKYSICSYNNIFHIFLLLIHSLYLLLHSISPHFYPILILHFTFVPNEQIVNDQTFIHRYFLFQINNIWNNPDTDRSIDKEEG